MIMRSVVVAGFFLLVAGNTVWAQQTPAGQKPSKAPPTKNATRRVPVLPDLTVKDIRLEPNNILHVLVANIGAADAPSFYVLVGVSNGDFSEQGFSHVPGLKAGQEMWLRIDKNEIGQSWTPITEASGCVATVDVSTPVNNKNLFDQQGKPLPAGIKPHVVESDEKNNSLYVSKANLKAWVPRGD